MSDCPRCGTPHAFTPTAILEHCTAVAAVEFNAKGQVSRIEFHAAVSAAPTPGVTRAVTHRRVVVETKVGKDGKRVTLKTRTV